MIKMEFPVFWKRALSVNAGRAERIVRVDHR
jgi:hypothetical protein